MRFEPLVIPGAYLIVPEPQGDERGSFARTWCRAEMAARGLATQVAQRSLATNVRRGTLRGMHYQASSHAEVKLVACTRGAAYDVLLDLRPGPSFGRWTAIDLRADDLRTLYVPAGVAHGYQTLEDGTVMQYQMDVPFEPAAARGVRWDDPAFGIRWPDASPRIISRRDREFPDWRGA